MNFKNVLLYVGATVLLALVTALLFFWGVLYHAGFFGYLGLSLSQFNLPHEYYLMAAWEDVFYAVGSLCTGFFLYRLVRWVGTEDGDFKGFGERFPWLSARAHSCASGVGPGALVLLIFLGLTCESLAIFNRGRRDARATARAKREVKFEKFGGEPESPLYFLAYAGGKYVVYARPDEHEDARVYVLNETEVGRVSFAHR